MGVYDVHGSRRSKERAMNCRAWLNGVEVTKRCFYADTRRGVVRLYKHNGDGRKYIADMATGEIAKEELRGRVVVRRKKASGR